MRAPLSIVIPTLNASEALQGSLPSLIEGLSAGLVRELVISDGGSDDATRQIAEGAGADFISGFRGRGAQLRKGANAASGDWLLFLHADTVLPNGWTETVRPHLDFPDRAACFELAFDIDGIAPRFVAGWANFRTRVFGLPYGDQGLLISRSLFDKIGGYPDIPLMEDVAIARALKGQLSRLPASVTTSAEKYIRDGWMRRGAHNWSVLAMYLLGVDPEELARDYDRNAL